MFSVCLLAIEGFGYHRQRVVSRGQGGRRRRQDLEALRRAVTMRRNRQPVL